MSKNWKYDSGQWNFICDVCGKKLKSHEGRKRWDGFMVCSDDWEPRHSLDFIRARADKISVPWTRPVPTDTFISDYTPSNSTWNGEGLNLMEVN